MALETEIKLSLPAHTARQVAAHPLLAGLKPLRQRLLNTYYDTPDLRLQRARIAVRYRKKGDQWLFTVKSAAPSAGGLARRNEWEAPGLPGEFDFSQVDDKKLRHWLESLRADLTPAFTTDFMRSAWLLEPRPGVRIELALDRGHIEAKGRRTAICELELELLAAQASAKLPKSSKSPKPQKSPEADSGNTGNTDDSGVLSLFDIALALQTTLPLHPASASKAERGYRLFASTAQSSAIQAVKAQPVALDNATPAIAAFRAVVLACLTHLQGNEQGVQQSEAAEFIHQARVAIRRLRSAIRAWKPLLPADFIIRFDPRWRELANALGEARNRDVFIGETLPQLSAAFPERPEVGRLSRHAQQHRTRSRKTARSALKSADYARLLLEFTAAVLALPENSPGALKLFARQSLDKRIQRVGKLAEQTKTAAHRHRLRVSLKRLRYALEYFTALFPGQRLQRYHQTTSRLQDLLGGMNDLEVAGQFTDQALPGKQGNDIRHWLDERNAAKCHELSTALDNFRQQQLPWAN